MASQDFEQDNPTYIHHPHHRNQMNTKSQWTIIEKEELSIFSEHYLRNWITLESGWGLYLINNNPNYLGCAKDGRQLFIAKFVCKQGQASWHGYPADPQTKNQDKPSTSTLNSWLVKEVLSTPQIRKISKGQICNL